MNHKQPLSEDRPPRPIDIDVIPPDVHPRRLTKLANIATVISLLVVAVAVGLILKWSFQSENILEIKNSPFPTQIVKQDGKEILLLTADYCKNTNDEGTLRTSFVSESREVFQPITKERLEKGCNKTSVPIIVPDGIPADTYKIKFRATYNLNPLKKAVTVEFESQPAAINTTP